MGPRGEAEGECEDEFGGDRVVGKVSHSVGTHGHMFAAYSAKYLPHSQPLLAHS